MIPPRGGHSVHGHFWIPIDDESCWAWSYDFHPTRALTDAEREAMRQGKGIHVLNAPGTYRPLANKDNDYLIDRAAAYNVKHRHADPRCRKAWARLTSKAKEPGVDRQHHHGAPPPDPCHKALAGASPPGRPAHQRVRSASLSCRPTGFSRTRRAGPSRCGPDGPATV